MGLCHQQAKLAVHHPELEPPNSQPDFSIATPPPPGRRGFRFAEFCSKLGALLAVCGERWTHRFHSERAGRPVLPFRLAVAMRQERPSPLKTNTNLAPTADAASKGAR